MAFDPNHPVVSEHLVPEAVAKALHLGGFPLDKVLGLLLQSGLTALEFLKQLEGVQGPPQKS